MYTSLFTLATKVDLDQYLHHGLQQLNQCETRSGSIANAHPCAAHEYIAQSGPLPIVGPRVQTQAHDMIDVHQYSTLKPHKMRWHADELQFIDLDIAMTLPAADQ